MPDANKVSVFLCYSHADKACLERLQVHLKPLARDYDIDVWADTKIKPGFKWRDEIKLAIERADVAVLIISADFLASDFIREDELPPLLHDAELKGKLIVPLIAGPSLFLQNPILAQFQSVNNPAAPLINLPRGEQEAIYLRVAEVILEKGKGRRVQAQELVVQPLKTHNENFLAQQDWNRLVKIGDWILDEARNRIVGSGLFVYLLSRDEYGDEPFTIEATLEFSNFQQAANMVNAGIIFGWNSDKANPRYYNILLTGKEVLVEKIGFGGGPAGQDYNHVTAPYPFVMQVGKSYSFKVVIDEKSITVYVDGLQLLCMDRPLGVVGRVGLRPWRSQMDCTQFTVRVSG
jgi:hypothetical protein